MEIYKSKYNRKEIEEKLYKISTDLYSNGLNNGYDYVDMGEAGIWAKYPIGVTNWETCYEDILYFQWGETEGYKEGDEIDATTFTWKNYKFSTEGSNSSATSSDIRINLNKYCNASKYGYEGFTDKLSTLELEDDVAHIFMSGAWRMPSTKDITRLHELCNHEYVQNYNNSGVAGILYTLRSDLSKQLFLPACGYRSTINKGTVSHKASYGYYWSNSLSTSPVSASTLQFHDGISPSTSTHARAAGVPVIGFISSGPIEESKFYTKEEVDDKLSNIDSSDVDLSNIEATKLKTPVKLWGNKFDGSKDMDGDLTVGGDFYLYGNNSYNGETDEILHYSDGDLYIGNGNSEDTVRINQDLTILGNITAENVKSIESKLEGVTKAADDSKVVKGIFDADTGVTAYPKDGIITLDCIDGISFNTDNSTISISADTNYLATKQDLKSKANDSEVIKGIFVDGGSQGTDDIHISSDFRGEIELYPRKGIIFSQEGSHILGIEVDTNDIATKQSVDDLKQSVDLLVNGETADNAFNTLKEVDTWIKSHEEEAADIISDVNEIKGNYVKTDDERLLDSEAAFFTNEMAKYGFIGPAPNNSELGVSYHNNYVDLKYSFISYGCAGAKEGQVSINNASKSSAGVMSAEDKSKLDSIEVSKLYTSDNLDMGQYYTKTQVDSKIPTNYIVSGEQTTTSTEDGGDNVYTFKTNGGATSTFNVKNGNSGQFSFNLLLRTLNGNIALGNDEDGVRTTKENFIDEDGCRVYKITVVTEDQSVNKGAYWWPNANLEKGVGSTFYPGHTYTISLDYKSDCEFQSGLFFNAYADADHGSAFRYNAKDAITYPISPEWKRISYQVTLTDDVKYGFGSWAVIVQPRRTAAKGTSVQVRKLCVTESNMSAWVPAESEFLDNKGDAGKDGINGKDGSVTSFNLLSNSNQIQYTWGSTGQTCSITSAKDPDRGMVYSVKVNSHNAATNSAYMYLRDKENSFDGGVEKAIHLGKYILSFDYYSPDSQVSTYFDLCAPGYSSHVGYGTWRFDANSAWKRVSIPFEITSLPATGLDYVTFTYYPTVKTEGITAQIANICLVEDVGNNWIPSFNEKIAESPWGKDISDKVEENITNINTCQSQIKALQDHQMQFEDILFFATDMKPQTVIKDKQSDLYNLHSLVTSNQLTTVDIIAELPTQTVFFQNCSVAYSNNRLTVNYGGAPIFTSVLSPTLYEWGTLTAYNSVIIAKKISTGVTSVSTNAPNILHIYDFGKGDLTELDRVDPIVFYKLKSGIEENKQIYFHIMPADIIITPILSWYIEGSRVEFLLVPYYDNGSSNIRKLEIYPDGKVVSIYV